MSHHVLFVCAQNVCRSPLMESVFREVAPPSWTTASAGVAAVPGQAMCAVAGEQVAAGLGWGGPVPVSLPEPFEAHAPSPSAKQARTELSRPAQMAPPRTGEGSSTEPAEPVAEEPQPVAEVPQPVAEEPQPVAEESQPVEEDLHSVAGKPQSVAEEPHRATEAPRLRVNTVAPDEPQAPWAEWVSAAVHRTPAISQADGLDEVPAPGEGPAVKAESAPDQAVVEGEGEGDRDFATPEDEGETADADHGADQQAATTEATQWPDGVVSVWSPLANSGLAPIIAAPSAAETDADEGAELTEILDLRVPDFERQDVALPDGPVTLVEVPSLDGPQGSSPWRPRRAMALSWDEDEEGAEAEEVVRVGSRAWIDPDGEAEAPEDTIRLPLLEGEDADPEEPVTGTDLMLATTAPVPATITARTCSDLLAAAFGAEAARTEEALRAWDRTAAGDGDHGTAGEPSPLAEAHSTVDATPTQAAPIDQGSADQWADADPAEAESGDAETGDAETAHPDAVEDEVAEAADEAAAADDEAPVTDDVAAVTDDVATVADDVAAVNDDEADGARAADADVSSVPEDAAAAVVAAADRSQEASEDADPSSSDHEGDTSAEADVLEPGAQDEYATSEGTTEEDAATPEDATDEDTTSEDTPGGGRGGQSSADDEVAHESVEQPTPLEQGAESMILEEGAEPSVAPSDDDQSAAAEPAAALAAAFSEPGAGVDSVAHPADSNDDATADDEDAQGPADAAAEPEVGLEDAEAVEVAGSEVGLEGTEVVEDAESEAGSQDGDAAKADEVSAENPARDDTAQTEQDEAPVAEPISDETDVADALAAGGDAHDAEAEAEAVTAAADAPAADDDRAVPSAAHEEDSVEAGEPSTGTPGDADADPSAADDEAADDDADEAVDGAEEVADNADADAEEAVADTEDEQEPEPVEAPGSGADDAAEADEFEADEFGDEEFEEGESELEITLVIRNDVIAEETRPRDAVTQIIKFEIDELDELDEPDEGLSEELPGPDDSASSRPDATAPGGAVASDADAWNCGTHPAQPHRSTLLEADDVKQAQLIIVASRAERSAVALLEPQARARTFTLREALALGAAPITAEERDEAQSVLGAEATNPISVYAAILDRRRGSLTPPQPSGPWWKRRSRTDPWDVPDVHQAAERVHVSGLRALARETGELAARMAAFAAGMEGKIAR